MNIKHPKSIFFENGGWWYRYPQNPLHRAQCFERTCTVCSQVFVPFPSHKNLTCSRKCGYSTRQDRPVNGKAEKCSRWTGGRIMRRGYVLLYVPGDPSLAGTTRTYVLEHRVVMEKHLNRPLTRLETVHHINGIKDDNRIENLQLHSKAHGAGVRHQCRTCGSNDIEQVEF